MKSTGLFLAAALVLGGCASAPQSADDQLASRIKQEIAQTAGIGNTKSLNVQTHSGVVILSGFLDNEQQKDDAAQAALKVAGVNKVMNDIQVLTQTTSGGSN